MYKLEQLKLVVEFGIESGVSTNQTFQSKRYTSGALIITTNHMTDTQGTSSSYIEFKNFEGQTVALVAIEHGTACHALPSTSCVLHLSLS